MIDARRARCWDKDWKYTKAEATDIRVLFERVRAQLKPAPALPANVRSLPRSAKQ